MANRKKKTIITGVTREDADVAFGVYAMADAKISKINADIELQCAKIREKYQSELGNLQCERECAFDTLQAYATENQAELFAKKKSLEMAHGTIGFRTGTPKLKTLKGFTWASALELLKSFLPGYVRQTTEIAKDKLLADRDAVDICLKCQDKGTKVSMREAMARCGIEVRRRPSMWNQRRRMRYDQAKGHSASKVRYRDPTHRCGA